jgi:predicted O-methyltransferase YrrM
MHGYPSGSLITVEGCPETVRFANKTLKDIPGVQVVNQRFIDFIPTLNPTYRADLVFIDGHHDGEALLGYIDQLLPHSHDETIFIVDDIRWSDCMYKAWQQLKGDHRFHVNIDFFRMGVLVKRPYQEKEAFTLSL